MAGPQKFWMVWNSRKENSIPTKRHGSLKSATDEAERLAAAHPGDKLYVLESMGLYTADAEKKVLEHAL